MKKTSRINRKVLMYSLIGLGFIALTFLVDWLFIIGAAVVVYLNQKELINARKRKD